MDRIGCVVCQDIKTQRANFAIESFYIVNEDEFRVLTSDTQLCSKHDQVTIGVPRQLNSARKFNRQQLKDACRILGCKASDTASISQNMFRNISDIVRSTIEVRSNEGSHVITAITITRRLFEQTAHNVLNSLNYQGYFQPLDFRNACDLVSKKRSITVLLGGTSGTGKSTLSSLIASRLGISTILSTDSIRHILRNFLNRDDYPVLFASTYETGKYVNKPGISEKQATLLGYQQQCELVYSYLANVIEDFEKRNESIVIEGVHLNVSVLKKLLKQFDSIIPFIIVIKNKKKHMERFAVRSRYMTLDPNLNRYIAYLHNIRTIQNNFIVKADEALIPKIDNGNIDRSVGVMHSVIIRCLRKINKQQKIYDSMHKQCRLLYEEFHLVARNMLSSETAQELIKSKANKGEIFARFFENNQNYEGDLQEEMVDKVGDLDSQSDETSSEHQDAGSLVSGDVDSEVIRFRNKLGKQHQAVSAASLKSRDDNSDDNVSSMDAASPGSYRSEDSDHSFEENGELNQQNFEESKQPSHKRKSSF